MVPRTVDPTGTSLKFHTSSNANLHKTPTLYFGSNAPFPRWRVEPSGFGLGKDNERDLIRTHPARTIVRGLRPDSHAFSGDTRIGLAELKWVFDPGSWTSWVSMNGAQLHDFALEELENALRDPIIRAQFRKLIFRGPYAASVANVADPLPPMPQLPTKARILPEPVKEASRRIEKRHTFYHSYKRPALVTPRRGRSKPTKSALAHPISSRIFKTMKGTQGLPGHISQSLDPEAATLPPEKYNSFDTESLSTPTSGEEELDPTEFHKARGSSPAPPEHGPKTARIVHII
ncbi:hypothetical protein N7462_002409 [Penicillium macrosclerotiorum]|uniref:uncharacterized protein n=1 Tax=Penicillium macrosclerotiorum TaxID=303699 RepID=UPI002548F099|nr:uncharacterized protein N7462_002409 [Penicillium macrosclerotiorum]KAJ5692986.1 hypothetical protein N7462_002409 [Penicillium macrosclerotiorum]